MERTELPAEKSSHPEARWTRSLQLSLIGMFQSSVDTARRLLPRSVKRKLPSLARILDSVRPSTELQFARRPIALAEWRPIFRAAEFVAGPIVLANNALAPGGVERQVVNTLRGLDQRNLPLCLLCLHLHEDPEFDFFLPGLRDFSGFVRNIMSAAQARAKLRSLLSAKEISRVHSSIKWMPPDVQADVLRFAAEFASSKPSVVHAWQDATNIAAGYGAWLVGVPRILVSSRNLAPTNFAYFRPYMLYGYREIASCTPVIMVNNSETGAQDYARWLGVPFDQFVVKRNGIDTASVKRPTSHATASLRTKLRIPADAKVVGSIFRFYAEKQPLLWVETAARLSKRRTDCHFVIFGEGPLQSEAKILARRSGIADRLHFPGNIQDSELGLSLFDVFLLTSKFEGTPNVVIEATLLAIPVVATDVGGTREAIAENITGLVAGGADPDELAAHVLEILGDPTWSARVRSKGPDFVEQRFGLTRMLNETVALYRS